MANRGGRTKRVYDARRGRPRREAVAVKMAEKNGREEDRPLRFVGPGGVAAPRMRCGCTVEDGGGGRKNRKPARPLRPAGRPLLLDDCKVGRGGEGGGDCQRVVEGGYAFIDTQGASKGA